MINKSNIIIFLLSVALILSLYHNFSESKKEKSSCLGKYKYISPDLNYDDDPTESTQELKKSVQNVVKVSISLKKADRVSVFYRDLINRQWFGIDENAVFSPASLLKLPLAIAYYKLAEVDKTVLTRQLSYVISDEKNLHGVQNIKPDMVLEQGKMYSVDELLRYMLQYSDNGAFEMLSKSINQNFLDTVSLDLGITFPTGGDISKDFVSVKTYGAIFRALFNSSYLNQELSDEILEVLVGSKFEAGIIAGTPKEVKVANKFGERKFFDTTNNTVVGIELHDCGVVYQKERPYVLCVMTQGTEYEDLASVIAKISKEIYENR